MPEIQAISLFELNRRVRDVLYEGLPSSIWIIAEISQITENRSGHCYLELVEKDQDNDTIMASSRATVWASRYRMIKPYFETTTRQALTSGIKIMASVKVEYHERYGLSLNIIDIEPSFTIGDLARKRIEIIRKLEEAGVLEMNRELEIALVPQKIAVISSQTAAGYEDFMHQLQNNPEGFMFFTKLFPAIMQGAETGKSIMEALDLIAASAYQFDAVVIIRGGGGKIDLSSFDDYELAYYITQFPLPVIAGIGHERDESVVDIIAHTSCKTPTAVAEFLIQQAENFVSELDELRENIINISRDKLSGWKETLVAQLQKMKYSGERLLSQEKMSLRETAIRGSSATGRYIVIKKQLLTDKKENGRWMTREFINAKKSRINMAAREADLQDPLRILKRGFSVSFHEGKVLKDPARIRTGDKIVTRLSTGSFQSQVTAKNNKKPDTR